MARKYYITDGYDFIGVDGTVVAQISKAKRFAFNDGQSFLQKQLQISPGWRLQRVFSTGKKYVITTAAQFVGTTSLISKEYATARAFRSAADAMAYIRNTPTLKRYIADPIILDDDFMLVDVPKPRQFTEEQLSTLGLAGMPTPAPRTRVNKTTLKQVYQESAGICALCGKPMTVWNRTIDHITPVSKGGKNNKENIRYVHKACNQMKGNLMDKDMYRAVSDIEAKHIYEDPTSQDAVRVMRAFVRGMIKYYKEAGYISA